MSDIMEYAPLVLAAAKKFGSYAQRDDLIQEGFIALLEIQAKLEAAESDLKQKLAGDAIRNRMTNYLRRTREPVSPTLTDEIGAVHAEFSAEKEDLKNAMNVLPGTERYILEEVFFHERTIKDVAASLGRNVSWVARRKEAAILVLREILDAAKGSK